VSDDLQVGKWGVTANVVTAISDALEANELIKVCVSGCPSHFAVLRNSICPEQNNVASFEINENIPHLSCCHEYLLTR
jgi:hypothetical protein